jgi:ribosome-binding factor A
MGDEKTAALTMHGLNSARGFLQSRVGDYIKSRYTPELRFSLDDGIRRSFETASLLKQVLPDQDSSELQSPPLPPALDPAKIDTES